MTVHRQFIIYCCCNNLKYSFVLFSSLSLSFNNQQIKSNNETIIIFYVRHFSNIFEKAKTIYTTWRGDPFTNYRVFRKNCVFQNSLQPLPRLHHCKRDLQSSQRHASVQSLLLAGNFLYSNSSRVMARERWQTFEISWKKTQYLMNTL